MEADSIPAGQVPDVVWFRRDLRLRDNPAWAAAVHGGRPLIALFVLDPTLVATAGDLRRRLLFAHLAELDRSLAELGGRLRVEEGDPSEVVPRLAGAGGRVFVNGDTTPYARRRDDIVAAALGDRFDLHWGTLVHAPGTVLTKAGAVSQVFTPFHKAWEAAAWRPWAELEDGHSAPDVLDDPGQGVPELDGPSPEAPGEAGAWERLASFDAHADDYLEERDLPSIPGTSNMSADLRFGTISPRRVATHIGVGSRGRCRVRPPVGVA